MQRRGCVFPPLPQGPRWVLPHHKEAGSLLFSEQQLSGLTDGLPGSPRPRAEQRVLGSDYILFFSKLVTCCEVQCS